MRLIDLLKNRRNQDLPRLAGGAPLPGERLSAAIQYMEPREAEAAAQMVDVWRKVPRADYDAFAQTL